MNTQVSNSPAAAQNPQTSELMECLHELKDTPIANDEHYSDLIRLCDAVGTIACRILNDVDFAERNANGNKEALQRNLQDISSLACQIISVSKAIDFMFRPHFEVSNIFYFYEKEREKFNKI